MSHISLNDVFEFTRVASPYVDLAAGALVAFGLPVVAVALWLYILTPMVKDGYLRVERSFVHWKKRAKGAKDRLMRRLWFLYWGEGG